MVVVFAPKSNAQFAVHEFAPSFVGRIFAKVVFEKMFASTMFQNGQDNASAKHNKNQRENENHRLDVTIFGHDFKRCSLC